jgi:hypothetical protein
MGSQVQICKDKVKETLCVLGRCDNGWEEIDKELNGGLPICNACRVIDHRLDPDCV